jgi:hypothetical protein
MKQEKPCLKNARTGWRLGRPIFARRITVGALALALGMTAISAPPHAAATPLCAPAAPLQNNVTVYLYDTNRTAVPRTDTYVTTEGGVYTDTGFAGNIDQANRVVDVNNAIVGYVVYPTPDD